MLPYLFILLLPGLATAKLCHPDDEAALLRFRYSFSNPELLPSWTPNADCCITMASCDDTTGRVTDLEITYSDLSGTIPDAVGDLTYLQRLRLRKMPFLVGEIPLSLTKLKHLTYLDISWTNISGHVPESLGTMRSLRFILLSFNRLSGPIPSSFASLPNITAIDLSRNQLTGPIPDSYGHFASSVLVALSLSHNKLSGEVPPSLDNVSFSQVDLSRNNFVGDASMFFGASKVSNQINIARNGFEFNFSKVTFNPDTLVSLDISHNKIYGTIPSQITESVMLQSLNVSYNRLCGEIPTGWKLRYRPEGFDYSSFIHNRCLCGPPLDQCKM